MKYFLDTEFIENGFMAPIDLISIGIVSEDGRELYLEHEDADLSAANAWVKANVIPHLGPWERRFSMADIKDNVLHFLGDSPEIWGWCAGFDYVLLSQVVGFNDWPQGWPYYIRDIQQEADQSGVELVGDGRDDTHNALADAHEIRALAVKLGIIPAWK